MDRPTSCPEGPTDQRPTSSAIDSWEIPISTPEIELQRARQFTDHTKYTHHRLPETVTPSHYDLLIKPDFTKFKFSGQVKIDYTCTEVTKTVVLNSVDLEVLTGYIEPTLNKLVRVTYTPRAEVATLEFQEVIPASGTMLLNFNGILNDKLKGFYRTTFKLGNETIVAGATQFEPNDARRCFPCWDEPNLKATFIVNLVIDKYLFAGGRIYERIVLSNMPEQTRTGPDAEVTIRFAKTPVMSTYLLAFVVGPFEMIEVLNKKRPVRVYTTPGKRELGEFALDVATRALTFYEDYFLIDYPLPKMDLVALPDFAFGAMENWGLITYRETRLLTDPEHTPTRMRQNVALVVAHEIAHQWFGNLVTMAWWTHLWLNEGFATFMEHLCIDALFPEYDIMSQFIADAVLKACRLDALHSSHPIEVPVGAPSDIDAIFDEISYEKGATVIRMLHEYIGDTCFRSGMNDYLSKFAFKNTVTEDLWDALERASDKPVRRMMSGWTSKRGYPWIAIEFTHGGGPTANILFAQTQYSADGQLYGDEKNALWVIPLNATLSRNPSAVKEVILLECRAGSVDMNVPGGEWWIKFNPGFMGLYRVAYPRVLRNKLLPIVANKKLPPTDRLNLHDDLFALCESGVSPTVELLELLLAYQEEDNYAVWCSIDDNMARLRVLMAARTPDAQELFFAYCRKLYRLIYSKLGWDPKPGELNETMTRAIVINRMLESAHEGAIAEAQKRFLLHVEGKAALPADLRSAVYKAIASDGDEYSYECLYRIHREAELAEEKNRAVTALASSRRVARLLRAIKYILSDAVKIQDKPLALISVGATNPDAAFKMIRDNRRFLIDTYESGFLLSRLVRASLENYASEVRAREIEIYFEDHPFQGTERSMRQALERIRVNAAWLARDGNAIEIFLSMV